MPPGRTRRARKAKSTKIPSNRWLPSTKAKSNVRPSEMSFGNAICDSRRGTPPGPGLRHPPGPAGRGSRIASPGRDRSRRVSRPDPLSATEPRRWKEPRCRSPNPLRSSGSRPREPPMTRAPLPPPEGSRRERASAGTHRSGRRRSRPRPVGRSSREPAPERAPTPSARTSHVRCLGHKRVQFSLQWSPR